MNKEIKIITLGDIFDNIETEEKAFKFIDYIKDLQEKVEHLQKENKILKENAEHNDKVVDKVNWKNMLLNNIINELEKWLIEQDKYLHSNHVFEDYQLTYYAIVLDKLKELKENK